MNKSNAAIATLLSLLLTATISVAEAGEFSAIVNGKSIHVNATEDWNEDNFGLGLEYQFETHSRWKKKLMANGFRDSSDEMSYMIGGAIQRNLFTTDRLNGFYIDAGVSAFVMTRRDVNDNRPFPGALPSVSIGNQAMGFNLTYLPIKAVESMTGSRMLDDTVSGIFFVQFKVNVSRLLSSDE